MRGRQLSVRYRIEGPYVMKKGSERPVFLVVVAGSRKKHYKKRRNPAFFVVTARRKRRKAGEQEEKSELPFEEGLLLSLAWQRWEIEVAHRELKSVFGLGEAQCWNARSVVMVMRWRAWLYAVMVLAGMRAWGLGRGPIRPPGRWWGGSGRWSLGTLWRGYRSEMWGVEEFREVLTPTGGGWVRKEGLMAGLENAVGGSQRV